MGSGKKKSPAEELAEFLNYIDAVVHEYRYAYDIVNEEDRRLQYIANGICRGQNREKQGGCQAAKRPGRLRRKNKDIVKLNERLVKFFEDQKNRETLNRMRQLLGQQRKEEEFLESKRPIQAKGWR